MKYILKLLLLCDLTLISLTTENTKNGSNEDYVITADLTNETNSRSSNLTSKCLHAEKCKEELVRKKEELVTKEKELDKKEEDLSKKKEELVKKQEQLDIKEEQLNKREGELRKKEEELCKKEEKPEPTFTEDCQTTTCPPCPQTTCPLCQSHCEISCPDSWVYNSTTGFCYKVFYEKYISYTYKYSESVCEKYNGHLASIHSDDENSFISGLHFEIYPFIGLSYDFTNKTFQWPDNTPVNYTNFYSNDTSTGLYCVKQKNDGWWYTEHCSISYGFVCKTRPTILQNNTLEYKIKDTAFLDITEGNNQTKPINSYFEQDKCSNTCPTCVPNSCTPCPCNTKCPDGWTYYLATNFCYKFYYILFDFSTAEQTCQQSNGHLISIHNANEDNFLKQFIAIYDGFWIGMIYNVSLSNFTWTDNTPYDYSHWYSVQPTINSNQYCVYNYGFGTFIWFTNTCNYSKIFVCKKPPNF